MLQDRLVDVPNAITRIWAEQGIYSFAPSPFRGGMVRNVARNSTHILFASVAEASGMRQLAAVDSALIEATKFGEQFG